MVITLILSAFALSFAFAPFGARFFAYFGLVPLLFLVGKYNYKKVFLYGLLFGSAFALFHLWWLYFLIVPVEPITRVLLGLGVSILFVYLGLYTALFSVVTKFLGIAFSPLVWLVIEFIRTKSEIGFPWGFLGYTQSQYSALTQLSSVFGVYGLSAWIVWVNLIVLWVLQKKHKVTYIIVLLLSFSIPIGFGLLRIKNRSAALQVAIIQPNVGPNEKGDRESRNRLISEMLELIDSAVVHKPDLIILPETATLVDITRSDELRAQIQSKLDSNNVYLFAGTPLFEPGSSVYYNGAVLFTPNKTYLSDDTLYQPYFDEVYRKIHLVPFSERIPYADKIPLIKKIETDDMGDATPGKEYTVFEINRTGLENPSKLNALICFEAIFPDLAREFTIRGSDLLVNITNDGWFGRTPGPYQHCELALLRSVENGVPLIRSANNGISLTTDAFGRIRKKTNLFTQTILIDTIPTALPKTIYRAYGDFFVYIALGLIVIGFFVRIFEHKKVKKLVS